MYINELAPKGNIKEFIPDFLLADDIPPQAFYSMESYLKQYGLNWREYIGFITGAAEMQETVYNSWKLRKEDKEPPKDDQAVWFTTTKVEDVRVFFRNSKSDSSNSIGSKVRLYTWGKGYKQTEESIQHLDSGFLNFAKSYFDAKMIFQNALASTVLYHSLYSIGSPASIRKLNVPAGADAMAPSFKTVTAMRTNYSEDINKQSIDHILTPAGFAAHIDDPVDFFGRKQLDMIVDILFDSKSFDDVREGLLHLPEYNLTEDDVDAILDRSNCNEANLSQSKDFDEAPGINIVATLDELANILD